jgi:hypothetical protein
MVEEGIREYVSPMPKLTSGTYRISSPKTDNSLSNLVSQKL